MWIFPDSGVDRADGGVGVWIATRAPWSRCCAMRGVGDDAVLIGHSFGGRVGILYASRNRVGKLVLVDAAGVKPRRSLKYYLKVYRFKAMKRIMYMLMGKARAERRLDEMRAKAGSVTMLRRRRACVAF